MKRKYRHKNKLKSLGNNNSKRQNLSVINLKHSDDDTNFLNKLSCWIGHTFAIKSIYLSFAQDRKWKSFVQSPLISSSFKLRQAFDELLDILFGFENGRDDPLHLCLVHIDGLISFTHSTLMLLHCEGIDVMHLERNKSFHKCKAKFQTRLLWKVENLIDKKGGELWPVNSVTRLGDLSDFRQHFKAFGNN